jgi:hypothetical protein
MNIPLAYAMVSAVGRERLGEVDAGQVKPKLEIGSAEMRKTIVITSILLFTGLAFAAIRFGWVDLPPQWSPWEPLDVAATPNLLTRYKLSRLSADGELCRRVLAQTRIDFEPLSDRVTAQDCGFHNAVLVRSTPSAVGEDFSLTCRAAVSLALWERHSLQPAARRYFGQEVARFEHFGSYSCRNVYGRPDATRSRHATAEAWDVAGFVLADGRRIRVANDWESTEASAAFLREVRDGACEFFDGVLSPDYNAAHRDHLHLDRGPYRVCR